MSKAVLWLHVGPAKTGTTTIQRFLQKHRERLLTHGLDYPQPPRGNPYNKADFAHHFLAQALIHNDSRLIGGFLETFSNKPEIILSAEGLSRLDKNSRERLSQFLENYTTKVVYYARDPADWANSMAQQLIKAGIRSYDALSRKPPKLDLRSGLESWADIFGHDNIVVRKFSSNDFINGDLVSDFFYAIGHDGLIDEWPRESHNSSMTLEAAKAIDQYRSKTSDKSFISSDDPRFNVGTTKFSLPPATLMHVRNRVADDIVWLEATFGINFSEANANTVKVAS